MTGALVMGMATVAGAQKNAPATEESPAPEARCDGAIVSRIEVDAQRPPFTGGASYWRRFARALGLHHRTTDTVVVRRYLALHAGEPCTEFRRQESERLLRAQPFIAAARVETVPDESAPGQVVVKVTTRDEIPVIVGAGVSGTQVHSALLGSSNLYGQAVGLDAHWSNHKPEGTTYGIHGEHLQFLGKPYTLLLDADRGSTGSAVSVGAGHGYLTDLQRIAWQAGFGFDDRANFLNRQDGSWVALGYRQRVANLGVVARIGRPRLRFLAGGFMSYEDVQRRGTSSAFAADSATNAEFPAFREVLLGTAVALRRVNYLTVEGFDALMASQDVATGFQLFTAVAHGLGDRVGAASDSYLFGDVYAGGGSPSAFVAAHARGEGRALRFDGVWDDVVASVQGALYLQPWSTRSLVRVWTEGSGGFRVRVPFQLDFHERSTGLLGYKAPLQGTRRWTAGLEARRYVGRPMKRFDFGIGAFTAAGKLYGGDRPFTATTPMLTSAGVSLFAGFPPGSKRLLRLDVGFPLRKMEGSGIEFRFTSISASSSLWTEPRDVVSGRKRMVGPDVFAP